MGMDGQRHTPAALPPGKRDGTHFAEGWVGPGPVWMGAQNLAPIGIRSPDRRPRSESQLATNKLQIHFPTWISNNILLQVQSVSVNISSTSVPISSKRILSLAGIRKINVKFSSYKSDVTRKSQNHYRVLTVYKAVCIRGSIYTSSSRKLQHQWTEYHLCL